MKQYYYNGYPQLTRDQWYSGKTDDSVRQERLSTWGKRMLLCAFLLAGILIVL